MKIIGLDISTTSTGISIYQDEKLLNYFSICPNGERMSDRFEPMARSLINVIEKEQPDIVGIEDTFMGVDANTTKFLTRLQGAVISWCLLRNRQYFIFVPNVWRSNLNFVLRENGKAVKRDALKEQSVKYVKEKFGVDCNDDESDAICIGLYVRGVATGIFEPPIPKKKMVRKRKKSRKESTAKKSSAKK